MPPSPDPRARGLYIHWPFCTRICPYCDFNVYRDRGAETERWRAALIREIDSWAERLEPVALTSIYFGGGTPSLMDPALVEAVIERARDKHALASDAEITLEANPGEADGGRLSAFAAAGVNRLSIGVQSFDDAALNFLGRSHSGDQAKAAIAAAMEIYPRVTFDLIYGLPDQSPEAWRAQLEQAVAFGAGHLSLYQLTIEPGTAFFRAVEKGRWSPPPEETGADLFDLAQDITMAAGLRAYEISNHARPGEESLHNLIYWRYQDYIGIGAGAHGRVVIDGVGHETKTFDGPRDYLEEVEKNGAGLSLCRALDREAQIAERLSMGLRLTEGVPLFADDPFYDDDARVGRLNQLVADGFLRLDCGRLKATGAGRPVLNRLLYELLS